MNPNVSVRLVLTAALLGSVAPASAQSVRLRPIDRATVRVVAIKGLAPDLQVVGGGPVLFTSTRISFGSGLAIERDLVVTAAHVIREGDLVLVIPPGETRAYPAVPRHVDAEHDVAFLSVAEPALDPVRLSEPRLLTLSEPVSVSGYPLDIDETMPASASGTVARVGEDGRVQVAIAINRGQSGGPLVDRRGRVLGILSAKVDPSHGAEGLAYAVPVARVQEARDAMPTEPAAFSPSALRIARLHPHLAVRPDEGDEAHQATLAVLRDALADASSTPEADAVIAGAAYNRAAAARVDVRELPDAVEAELFEGARALAARALRDAPHLSACYPVLHHILVLDDPVLRPPPGVAPTGGASHASR